MDVTAQVTSGGGLRDCTGGDPVGFVHAVIDGWDLISESMATRATQTNEAARTGTFLPLLAQIDGPVALIEVGCSAGLCLYPDRYRISYDGAAALVADSPVPIEVTTTGAIPIPLRLPDVVARIGVDVNPLDVADDLPTPIAGDLVDTIDDALALVPDGATPVVFHSAVLNHDDRPRRSRSRQQHRSLPGGIGRERCGRHLRPAWLLDQVGLTRRLPFGDEQRLVPW